jgi:cob(I)alamin adenosyltransferase
MTEQRKSQLKLSTRRGDDGTSGLFGGERFPKDNPIFDALGDLDELTSVLGVCRANAASRENTLLEDIQKDLGTISALLSGAKGSFGSEKVSRIEILMEKTKQHSSLSGKFVFPGKDVRQANLHLSRAVCRRAERSVIRALRSVRAEISAFLTIYLNRLSDFLYILAETGPDEVHD